MRIRAPGALPLNAVFCRHLRGSMTTMARAGVIVSWFVVAAVGVLDASDPDLDRAGDDRAIQQLLIENILAEDPAWHGYSADTFCIAVGRLEWKEGVLVPPDGPSPLFLARISARGKTVLPGRSCQVISMGIGGPGVVTVADKRPAFFITVSDVTHRTSTVAEAHAGFLCGSMCAWGVTFELEKHDGRWFISGRKNLVLS